MLKRIKMVLIFLIILIILLLVFKNIKKDNRKEIVMKNINVIIDNKNYSLEVYDNETVKSFLKMLPKEFKMQELNGNEKYIYLDEILPTNPVNPKQINKGDVMLYGNNCLVIFYKTFTTNYSYTLIGHIDNLPDLNKDNLTVKFE